MSRFLASLLVVAMLSPLVGAVPASAASTFTGGAIDTVLFVPNDHTPVGFRWSASGLTANTPYNVKVRFTKGTSPSPSTNRGLTWNATTATWVPDLGGGNWTDYPSVTSDAGGAIAAGWVFSKFASEVDSGSYYVMISLFDGATTYNSTVLPLVTVIDMKTAGAWAHNGIAVSPSSLYAKRSACTSETSSAVVYSLGKTELDLVDNDDNGVVDDENYGPAGSLGDFRHALPLGMRFNVILSTATTWASAQELTVADTDIALGATDMVAPTAPASLIVEPGTYQNSLTWGAATDSGGSGLAGYNVYRWEDSGSPLYTLPKTLIATPTAGVTTFTDEDVYKGGEYFYEVRAVDAATNVGPRSSQASGVPFGMKETLRASGTTRYTTAVAISEANFPPSSVTTAVVATGKDFPDALSASGLAGVYGSPVLLVGDSVTASLTAELDRLGVTDVVLIGGDGAISPAVEAALAVDYAVDRVEGSDRFATAAAVATRIVSETGGNGDAFFVRGDDFADAIALAPFAYGQVTPVLLVRTGSVPLATSDAITDLGISSGVIAGGTGAVSAPVMTTLDGMLSGTPERIGGTTRYETARLIADYAVAAGWGDYSYVGIATGLNYPDALGGAAAAAQYGGVLLLTDPTTLSAPAASAITANKGVIDWVEVYGGTGAVSSDVFDSIVALLQ